ncbi:MAG: FHA domain-containing protein, partial [Gemmatimonadaceae bacterium]|nr:FHA domain-containing protein [Gemmatimonadaceae bacterium]
MRPTAEYVAMVKMLFRHISGTRAAQADLITLGSHRELILGRAPSAAVRFDPHDRHVGRHHARISWTDEEPPTFSIMDLRSVNGTFVNGRLITAPMRLSPGDIVQLGFLGPEVEVRWESA